MRTERRERRVFSMSRFLTHEQICPNAGTTDALPVHTKTDWEFGIVKSKGAKRFELPRTE